MDGVDLAAERAFLSSIPIFGGLEPGALETIIAMLQVHRFPVGASVCNQGDSGRSMYVVRRGEVVVCRQTPGGKRVRMVRMGPGEFFGEMTLIDPQPRSATIVVEVATTLYALSNRDLYDLYRQDVHTYVMVLQNICRELSRRLRKLNTRVSEMAERTGDERTLIGPPPVRRP